MNIQKINPNHIILGAIAVCVLTSSLTAGYITNQAAQTIASQCASPDMQQAYQITTFIDVFGNFEPAYFLTLASLGVIELTNRSQKKLIKRYASSLKLATAVIAAMAAGTTVLTSYAERNKPYAAWDTARAYSKNMQIYQP